MDGRFRSGHLGRETLQAYLSGEVDPAQRAVIEAHLEQCPACTDDLHAVEAVLGLFERMKPRGLDDVSWQRLGNRVATELQARAALDLPRSRFSAPRWFSAALATAAVLALIVWSTPRQTRRPTRVQTPVAGVRAPTIIAAEDEFRFSLTSRAVLVLGPRAQVALQTDQARHLRLELVTGELTLQVARTEPLPRIEVRSAGLTVFARSRDFRVTQLASEVRIEVREGEVRVEGDDVEATIEAGQTQSVPHGRELPETEPAADVPRAEAPPAPVTETPSASGEAPASEQGEARARPTERVAKTASAVRVPAAPAVPPAAEAVEEPRAEPVAETRVTVTPPKLDPIAQRWAEAMMAYERGDIERAVLVAEELAASGLERSEVAQAKELLCEGWLSLGKPQQAVRACEAVAEAERDPEEARALHFRIATIYRVQLGDCERALPYYDRANVFGGRSMRDEEVLLGRAACALDTGRLDVAERDLSQLSQRNRELVKRSSYLELVERLDAAKARTNR